MEKKLQIILAGQLIGEFKMTKHGQTTIVESDGIIPNGLYLMHPREVKEMIYRRVIRDNVEIRKYQ